MKEKKIIIALATSKPHEFAIRILQHFDLYPYFDYFGAATMDGSICRKTDVIAHLLNQFGDIHKSSVLMVGDRDQDIAGAKANGLCSAGALWGYGSFDEFQNAGADYVLSKPAELHELICGRKDMNLLYVTHYYVRGTDPWKNIMLLSEEAAFRKAAELASAHKGMTSYGRFADFKNYYPLRKAADKLVREQFICLGGKPQLEHPYSFVLGESDYLKTWFDEGDSLRIPLDEIPDELISFTPGDSCAKLSKNDSLEVLTKPMLMERLHNFDDSPEKLVLSIAPYGYVEAQLWYRPADRVCRGGHHAGYSRQ